MKFVFKPELLIITVLDIVLLSVASLLCSSTITSVERQPPCPRATTILAGFQAAEVGVSFNVSG
jgi:hypothetical protein